MDCAEEVGGLAKRLATATNVLLRNLIESLSGREFEVLRLIGSGKTVSQIAEMLHLSVRTVSTYLARILEKMSMKTTAELINYAVRNRLVD